MVKTHSRVAPQNVSEILACEHPERIRGAKHLRQPYSSQKFITEHSDLQPWHRYRSGQKASAPNTAAGRTCLKRPVGRRCWAGAGVRPGQAKDTGSRQA